MQQNSSPVDAASIEQIVLTSLDAINQSRAPEQQLDVTATSPIFGDGSSLDSLGLVALLIEIEEQLSAIGINVTLGDERAMSPTRSPFRDVPSLVEHIRLRVSQPS